MDKNYKIIVAHPGKQHSFQLAEALKKDNILFKYATTVYAKKWSLTNIFTKLFLRGDNFKKASTRKSNALDEDDIIQFNELYALITLILSRINILNKFYLHWTGWVASNFYKKVMIYAKKNKVDAVIVYDGYSNKHFEIIENTNIISIMDVSIASRKYLKTIFEAEIKEYGINKIKENHYEYWNRKMMDEDIRGIKTCKYFLAPSMFVKKSLLYCGIDENKIELVPYGVDVKKFNIDKKIIDKNKLKLIYVGQVSYRKGMHHLLEVVSLLEDVQLTICGGYEVDSDLYCKYSKYKNIIFEGFVTRDILKSKYQEADVFVLASLGEGLALVGLEALACGLPLICTENSGVNDLINNYENGIVIPASNQKALKDAIKWFEENRGYLPKMKQKAREVSIKYSWEIYHKNVAMSIRDILEREELIK